MFPLWAYLSIGVSVIVWHIFFTFFFSRWVQLWMISSWDLSSTFIHQFSIGKKALFYICSRKINRLIWEVDYCARFGNDRKCFHGFHHFWGGSEDILWSKFSVSWRSRGHHQVSSWQGSRAEKLRAYIQKPDCHLFIVQPGARYLTILCLICKLEVINVSIL